MNLVFATGLNTVLSWITQPSLHILAEYCIRPFIVLLFAMQLRMQWEREARGKVVGKFDFCMLEPPKVFTAHTSVFFCLCACARASKRLSFPSRKNFCPKLLYDIAAAAAMTHRSWRQLWRSFGGGALLTQSATWSGMFWPHFHPSYMANRTMALFGCLKPIYSDYRITWQQMMVQCLLDIVNSTVLWQNSHHVQYVTIKYMPHIANHDSQNKQ